MLVSPSPHNQNPPEILPLASELPLSQHETRMGKMRQGGDAAEHPVGWMGIAAGTGSQGCPQGAGQGTKRGWR